MISHVASIWYPEDGGSKFVRNPDVCHVFTVTPYTL
jgi:hypothetical protein